MNPSIEQLEILWASLLDLCADLTEEQWKTPTGCPGWTVQDNVSHLIDYEAGALGRPRPDHVAADVSHTKNDLGAANEHGVDARRSLPGSAVLDELREVTAARVAQLHALTDDDLAQEAMTPAGPGTVATMLQLRVMDTWSHEQDIRRAIGRPGHESGPAVDGSLAYWAQFLPLIVTRRASAPDGSTVVLEVGDALCLPIAVDGGRGRALDAPPSSPTVTLRCTPGVFAAHVGGRSDARAEDIAIDGDEALGRAVVGVLGFLP